jgi:hypothetical protein
MAVPMLARFALSFASPATALARSSAQAVL